LAPVEAAIEACRLRLRPILMTSFAFIMGVVPLVIASGAGSEMRQAIGIAVFAGMLGVTTFGLFLTPVFFVSIETWLARLKQHPDYPQVSIAQEPPGAASAPPRAAQEPPRA
jgi:Cu/Ag efflux pump CusA